MVTETLQKGTILHGKYCIQEVAANGGSSVVYRAKNFKTRVILKECFVPQWMTRQGDGEIVPLPGQEAQAQAVWDRFAEEAQYLAALRDVPDVGKILEQFSENGTQYLVLEEQEGITLRQYCATHSLRPEQMIQMMLPLIDILSEVHRRGILHLDMNPDNLLVERDGTMHLLDFGNACFAGERPALLQAQPAYSAVELYDNAAPSAETDVYGVCAVLYEALTGRPPEPALERLLFDELPAPSALNREISSELEGVILKGLSLNPEARFAAMDDLASALKDSLRRGQTRRRRQLLAWGSALCAALCGVLLWLWLWEPPAWYETVETETFSILIDHRMSDADRLEAEEELNRRLTAFAGTEYLLREEDHYWVVTVPYDCFQGRPIADTVKEQFSDLWRLRRLQTYCQPVVSWYDAADVPELPWIVTVYEAAEGLSDVSYMTSRQECTIRMDSLQTTYLLGIPGNMSNQIAVAVSQDDYDPVVLQSAGGSGAFYLGLPSGSAEPVCLSNMSVGEVQLLDDTGSIQLTMQEDWNIEALFALSDAAMREATPQIILYHSMFGEEVLLFICEVGACILNGQITLQCCQNQREWLPAYLRACLLETEGEDPYDPIQQYCLEQPVEAYQNVNPVSYLYQPPASDPLEAAAMAIQALGISTRANQAEQTLTVFLQFPLETDLPALSIACLQRLAALPEVQTLECPTLIYVVDPEETGAFYTVTLAKTSDRKYAMLRIEGEALEPYQEEIKKLWTEDALGEPFTATCMP